MKFRKIFNHKLVLGFSNLALTLCGIVLLFSGFILYTDTKRILLSRLVGASSDTLLNLSHPFFYYIALGLAGAGLIAIFASFVGWWATCLNNYCMLSIYFLVVLFLLLVEFSVCLMITIWPQCLGLNLDETLMVKKLQGGYGVPGKEQLTAAIDLAQTLFKCCAINSNLNYDMSLWRLQGYGQRDWAVPQTCCILSNGHEPLSYLDPKPQNLTLCQSLLKHEYGRARYTDSCLEYLDEWYRQHYVIFLVASLVVAIVEFAVLLSIILSCTRLSTREKRLRFHQRTTGTTMQTNVKFDASAPLKRRPAPQRNAQASKVTTSTNENVYMTSAGSEQSMVCAHENQRSHYADPIKLNDDGSRYPYQMSKSYLV